MTDEKTIDDYSLEELRKGLEDFEGAIKRKVEARIEELKGFVFARCDRCGRPISQATFEDSDGQCGCGSRSASKVNYDE